MLFAAGRKEFGLHVENVHHFERLTQVFHLLLLSLFSFHLNSPSFTASLATLVILWPMGRLRTYACQLSFESENEIFFQLTSQDERVMAIGQVVRKSVQEHLLFLGRLSCQPPHPSLHQFGPRITPLHDEKGKIGQQET